MASPALSTVLQYEPTARYAHCTAVVNGRLLMYGGTDSDGKTPDEPPSVVEVFEDGTWKSMLTTGELPEGYAGLTATAVADTLLTFAGVRRKAIFSNKLFALHTVSLEWKELHPVNPDEAPSAKLFSAIIAFGRNMLCNFGGQGPIPTSPYPGAEYVEDDDDRGDGWNNELACYDLSKGVLCITLFTLLCNSVHTGVLSHLCSIFLVGKIILFLEQSLKNVYSTFQSIYLNPQ